MSCRKCTARGKRIKKPKITFVRGIVNPRKILTPAERRAAKGQ